MSEMSRHAVDLSVAAERFKLINLDSDTDSFLPFRGLHTLIQRNYENQRKEHVELVREKQQMREQNATEEELESLEPALKDAEFWLQIFKKLEDTFEEENKKLLLANEILRIVRKTRMADLFRYDQLVKWLQIPVIREAFRKGADESMAWDTWEISLLDKLGDIFSLKPGLGNYQEVWKSALISLRKINLRVLYGDTEAEVPFSWQRNVALQTKLIAVQEKPTELAIDDATQATQKPFWSKLFFRPHLPSVGVGILLALSTQFIILYITPY
ncbi:unnamed protein product [Thelazia callipaeda]|uniref:SAM domain-containing protein n=1 Tax=Thelazia callipaeda TaxID=103827 RepID=A0A0N5D7N1_THECL|nr:unnamed protein product [Thelazia callipaeda]